MRLATALLGFALAFAACSREPGVDLAESTRGMPLEEMPRHSLEIDADGHVMVDGTACATDEEFAAAVVRVAEGMENDVERASTMGYLHVPQDPLLVRIDAAARFADVANRALAACNRAHIVRFCLAVRDAASREERFLRIEYSDPISGNYGLFHPTERELSAGVARICCGIVIEDPPTTTPSCVQVDPEWTRFAGDHRNFLVTRPIHWDELCNALAPSRVFDAALDISVPVAADTPWREIVPIVEGALDLDADSIEFWPDLGH